MRFILLLIFVTINSIFTMYSYGYFTFDKTEIYKFNFTLFFSSESHMVLLISFLNILLLYFNLKIYDNLIKFMLVTFIFVVVLIGALVDIKESIIPNKITHTMILIGLIFLPFNPLLINAYYGLIGGFIAFTIFFILSFFGMGMGDAKLMFGLGLFLGVEIILFSIMMGFLIGSIQGITLWIINGYDKKMKMPFGPALSLGTFITTFIIHGNLFDLYKIIGLS